jgi:CHAT domain-containing protein
VAAGDLRGLELVVLSACESALGRVDREGVFGLQTAFHLAGVRTVVASLWKVEDRAAQALMVEFHRNLWDRKLPRLEALRQAQRTLRRDFDPRTGTLRGVGGTRPDPPAAPGPAPAFFWAAFSLSGDWR